VVHPHQTGIDVPAPTARWATGGLTFLFLLGYYMLARYLEHIDKRFGILLGIPAKPSYPEIAGKPTGEAGIVGFVVLLLVILVLLGIVGAIVATKWLLLLLVVALVIGLWSSKA